MAKTEFLPAPKSADEAFALADLLAKSELLPKDFRGKPSNIVIGMMWSHNLGIPFLQGMQYIAVVNGKPSMYGDGALAVVMASGLVEDFNEQVVAAQDGKLCAICTVKRRGIASPFVRQFTQRDAEVAFLWNKQGPWKQYPKRMLQMRARAYALRDAFPDVLSGMGIAEEQQDVADSIAAPGAAVSATAQEAAAPARKMPRRKSAPKPSPAPEPAPVVHEDVEDIEPITAPAHEPEPVEAVEADGGEAQSAPIEDEVPAPEVPSIEWRSRIEAAGSYDELKDVWHSLPASLRADTEVTRAFFDRRDALAAAVKGA